ncbi:MAG: hypothetical protein WA324_12255 [Bryobacteraceae bacterium]
MSPTISFIVLVIGIFACIWELMHPGGILAGVAGVGMITEGGYWLWEKHPSSVGVVCVMAGVVLLAGAASKAYLAAALASAIGLSVGFILLFPAPLRISPALAIAVSTIVSFVSAKLVRTAIVGYLCKREH